MESIDALLSLAEDCYTQARSATNPVTKAELMNMGDRYVQTAEAMQRERPVIARAELLKPSK